MASLNKLMYNLLMKIKKRTAKLTYFCSQKSSKKSKSSTPWRQRRFCYIQNLNKGFIGADKWSLPNFTKHFPNCFYADTKIYFSPFCSGQDSFQPWSFFGLFNHVPSLEIFPVIASGLFPSIMFLYVFFLLQFLFLLHNSSLHFFFLWMFFESINKKECIRACEIFLS